MDKGQSLMNDGEKFLRAGMFSINDEPGEYSIIKQRHLTPFRTWPHTFKTGKGNRAELVVTFPCKNNGEPTAVYYVRKDENNA